MRINRLSTLMLSASFFFGSGFLSIPSTALGDEPTATVMKIDSSTKETLFALHYAIIPEILFSENGPRFFNDLYTGNTKPFRDIVEGALGKEYAEGMTFTPAHKNGYDLVLISFPEPRFEALSIQAALVKMGGKYRFITLENFSDTATSSTKTIMGELTADNRHMNLGSKRYADLNSFQNDLDKLLNR